MKFFDEIYILCFEFKNTIENEEFYFLNKICEIQNKVYDFFSFLKYLEENKLF